MNSSSLGKKVKEIVAACSQKACHAFLGVKNALIHFFKKPVSVLCARMLSGLEKVGGAVLYIANQFRQYYQNVFHFLIENNKKEIAEKRYNHFYKKIKEGVSVVYSALRETGRKFFIVIFRRIEKNEKLSRFFKKWGNEITGNFVALKKTVAENYQEIKKIFSQYDWYQQIAEASRPEDRKITLLACFFCNLLALAFPMSIMQMYDRIIPNQSYTTLTILSIGVCVAILLEMTLRIFRSYINLWADAKYEYAMSKKAFSNLIQMPLYLYEDTDIGTRIKQFSVLDQLRGFYNNQLMAAIFDIPFLMIFLIVIYYVAGWLVIAPIILGMVLLISSFYYINQSRDMLEKKLNLEAKENDFLVNVLGNIHTAKSLAIENLLIRRYERMQNTSVEVNYDSTVHTGDIDSIKSVFSQLGTVLVGGLGAISVIHGNIAIGSLIACVLLTGRFMAPLVRFVAALGRWKMINIIRQQLDVVLNEISITHSDPIEIQGEIELKNLGYLSKSNDTEYWALKNVTAVMPPRSMIAIIGNSKHDNEKLLSVLACIARPTTGEYLIDQKNVNDINHYPIRNTITYLSKSGTLFQGTIMDNITAFNPDYIPEAEHYANILGLNKILLKLPFGYDTSVGDKTVHALPGSVVNLIYIIRALINKPKIILFDPTDMDLEEMVKIKLVMLLKTFKQIATVIVLSTDRATTHLADVIFELQNGELKRV